MRKVIHNPLMRAIPNGPVTAWTDAQALPFAAELCGLVAFYAQGLTFIEHVPEASVIVRVKADCV